MVEHTAVNRGVVGSSPTRGVNKLEVLRWVSEDFFWYFTKNASPVFETGNVVKNINETAEMKN